MGQTVTDPEQPALTTGRDIVGLFAFLGLVFLVSGIGGAVTVSSVGGWYQTLTKPSFTPPDWVFGPVWSALYIMMAVAGWRAWRRSWAPVGAWALAAYATQLILNLAWPILFFGLQWIGIAAVGSLLLLVASLATVALLWRIELLAGALLTPYALWLAFATALNVAFWRLN